VRTSPVPQKAVLSIRRWWIKANTSIQNEDRIVLMFLRQPAVKVYSFKGGMKGGFFVRYIAVFLMMVVYNRRTEGKVNCEQSRFLADRVIKCECGRNCDRDVNVEGESPLLQ